MKVIVLLLIVTLATVNLFEASGLGGHRSHGGSSLSFVDDDSRSEDSGDSRSGGSRDADSSDESSDGTSEGSSEDGSSDSCNEPNLPCHYVCTRPKCPGKSNCFFV